MKCQACDCSLTDFESSARGATTGDYLDMCSRCLSYIREVIQTTENFLLYNPDADDLDTRYDGSVDMALSELIGEFEDDSAAAVDGDGARTADGGGSET